MLYFSRAKDGRQEEDSAVFGGVVVVVVLWFWGDWLLVFWNFVWLVGWAVGFVFRLFI